MAMNAQPQIFVTHGSPTLILDDCPARDFLAALGRGLARPQAVLCVSAHWETDKATVSSAPAPATIHDFGGFPQALFDMRYPAPGAPALAGRVQGLLNAAGLTCRTDPLQGLDHGAWVPLKLLFPAADVPVLQLSVSPALSARHHARLGAALAPLAEEGVLILGSGSATHNLRELVWRDIAAPPAPFAQAFDDWLVARAEAGDLDALADFRRAPEAQRNHPTDEHYLPVLVPAGAAAARGHARAHALHRSFTYGTLAMTAFGWGF
jgi:4,5-DOPA dioxygenase extradiol